MKTILVRSLCSMVPQGQQRKARQFLLGLSTDELQCIAEFLGSCILESERLRGSRRADLSECIQRFYDCRNCADAERRHKGILLIEFLRRCGLGSDSLATQTGQG
jgi:hypothetical protein